MPITQLHNGATLNSVGLTLQGAAAHMGLPTTMPAFAVYRTPIASPTGTPTALYSSTFVTDSTGLLATYKTAHMWTLPCNQTSVIDTTQYAYFAIIWDEGGTNAVVGNFYSGLLLTYTSIADMRFP
jgi:hypothetical protein